MAVPLRQKRKSKDKSRKPSSSPGLNRVDIVIICVGLLTVFSLQEFGHLGHTLYSIGLLLHWALIGLAACISVSIFLHTVKRKAEKSVRTPKVKTMVVLALCSSIIFPAAASFLNRQTADETTCADYYILDLVINRRGAHLVVKIEGWKKQVSISRSLGENLSDSEKVHLCLSTGFLGYRYVWVREPGKW